MQVAANITLASQTALSSVLNCPVFVGQGTMLEETECVWGKSSHQRSKISDSSAGYGFVDHSTTLLMGAQRELAPNWFAGGSLGFTQSSGHSSDNYTQSSGDSVNATLALKHQMGPWLFAGAAQIGYGYYAIENVFDVGDDVWSASAHTRIFGQRAFGSERHMSSPFPTGICALLLMASVLFATGSASAQEIADTITPSGQSMPIIYHLQGGFANAG